jgi:hypothetical protein
VKADRLRSIADQKALLRSRAEFARTSLALSLLEIRSTLTPAAGSTGFAARRPMLATVFAFVAPFLGATGVARWLRIISLSLAAIRVVRSWRRAH